MVFYATFQTAASTVFQHFGVSLLFRYTEALRSEKSTETSYNSTEVSGEIKEIFESVSIPPKHRDFHRNISGIVQ
jgi:hypothetical protein